MPSTDKYIIDVVKDKFHGQVLHVSPTYYHVTINYNGDRYWLEATMDNYLVFVPEFGAK